MLVLIKDECEVQFRGNTAKKVYDFIGGWYPRTLQIAEVEQFIGITIYSARKIYDRDDIHGEWEETKNLRDTIAHEKLKGAIIRSRNSVDALIDFEALAQKEKLFNMINDEPE